MKRIVYVEDVIERIVERLEKESFWVNPIPYEDMNYACKVVVTNKVIEIIKTELSLMG